MFRRWKFEMNLHDYDWRNPPELSCKPSEQGVWGVCHCASGKGALRKVRPLGHSRRCFLCNGEKYLTPKRRLATKRSAIEYELKASAL